MMSKSRAATRALAISSVAALCLACLSCKHSVDLISAVKTEVMKANGRCLEVESVAIPLLNDGTFSPTGTISIVFDRAIDAATANSGTVIIKKAGAASPIDYSSSGISYVADIKTLKIRVLPYLDISSDYTITIAGVLGADKSAIAEAVTRTFSTGLIEAGTISSIASTDKDSVAGYSIVQSITLTLSLNSAYQYVSFSISADGGASWLYTGAVQDRAQSGSVFTIQVDGLPEGRDVILARCFGYPDYSTANPKQGTDDTATIVVDMTKPNAPAVAAATPTNAPTWTWSGGGSADSAALYRYQLEATTGSWTETAATTYNYAPAPNVYEPRKLYVEERDAAGNWSEPASASVTVDTTPPVAPTVTLASPYVQAGSTYYVQTARPSWGWSAGGGGAGAYRYQLDSASGTWAETAATGFMPAASLSEGAHILYVEERDEVGNWSSHGSFTLVVDTLPPNAPAVTGATPTNDATPTWTWASGGGGNGTFRYRCDSEAEAETTVTSYTPASSLSEGTHVLYVKERDAVGNWSSYGSRTIAVDTTPPAALTVTGATPTNDTTPTWSWNAVTDATGYRYQLDGYSEGSWTETSARTYTPASALAARSYTLYVEARDAAGNWSSYGSFTILVDTTAPDAPTVTVPSATNVNGTYYVTSSQPTWSWGAVAGATIYRYQLDGYSEGSWTATTGTTCSPNLSDGPRRLYVEAGDAAGNWSDYGSFAIVVDSQAPNAPAVTVSGTTFYDGTYYVTTSSPAWTWSPGGGGNGNYRYQFDGIIEANWTTTTTVTAYSPSLSDGTHSLYVEERDEAGNWSAYGSFAVTVDTTPPGTPAVTVAAATNNNGTYYVTTSQPTWSWSPGGGGDGNYRYQLDGYSEGNWTTTTGTTCSPSLTDGSHSLYAEERDAVGHWSAYGSFSIVVDTQAPNAPAVSVSGTTLYNGKYYVTTPSPDWSWSSGGGGNGSYRYQLDGSIDGYWTTTTGSTCSPNLSDGPHCLYVEERDEAGNWSTYGSYAVVVDTAPPQVASVGCTGPTINGYLTEPGSLSLAIAASDAASSVASVTAYVVIGADTKATISCTNDGSGTWRGVWTYTDLGTVTAILRIRVVATDVVGLVFDDSFATSLSVDAMPPSINNISVSGDSGTVTVTVDATDSETGINYVTCSVSPGYGSIDPPSKHEAPYTFSWATQGDGSATVTAVAFDKAGNTKELPLNFSINN